MTRGALLLVCAVAFASEPEYVKIPAGSFTMAAPKGQRVEIPAAFLMHKTEVTVDQFRAFVQATGHQTVAEQEKTEQTWRNPGFPLAGNQPVVFVNFRDAEAFCRWKSARLPTEGEWEYASRAGSAAAHSYGEGLDERYVWYRENSNGAPQPVGTKAANPWGLYDMEGNVWEWTTGERYVMRGGSWVSCPTISPWATTASPLLRVPISTSPNKRDDDIGFRCVK